MNISQAILEMLERGGWAVVEPDERDAVAELIGQVIAEQEQQQEQERINDEESFLARYRGSEQHMDNSGYT